MGARRRRAAQRQASGGPRDDPEGPVGSAVHAHDDEGRRPTKHCATCSSSRRWLLSPAVHHVFCSRADWRVPEWPCSRPGHGFLGSPLTDWLSPGPCSCSPGHEITIRGIWALCVVPILGLFLQSIKPRFITTQPSPACCPLSAPARLHVLYTLVCLSRHRHSFYQPQSLIPGPKQPAELISAWFRFAVSISAKNTAYRPSYRTREA